MKTFKQFLIEKNEDEEIGYVIYRNIETDDKGQSKLIIYILNNLNQWLLLSSLKSFDKLFTKGFTQDRKKALDVLDMLPAINDKDIIYSKLELLTKDEIEKIK